LALEINNLIHELGITTVLAGDAPSTRALIEVRDLIDAHCFPMPSREIFDRLNDKWRFSQLCLELGIPHPATRLVPDVAALAEELSVGSANYPFIAKPLRRSGNAGVVVFDGAENKTRLRGINYQPILVQDFVPGRDSAATVYVTAGRIRAFVSNLFWHQVYSTYFKQEILDHLGSLVRHLNLDGVYNFDVRLAHDGSVYFLECNPRFYYKINLAMIAGLNFVSYGLPGARIPDAPFILSGPKVRLPKALLFSLFTSGRCTRRDWEMAGYLFSDPVPYLMEKFRLTI
jgi:predicted ATP-grasp superfamily ATP-dependent carboligase